MQLKSVHKRSVSGTLSFLNRSWLSKDLVSAVFLQFLVKSPLITPHRLIRCTFERIPGANFSFHLWIAMLLVLMRREMEQFFVRRI